jgi:hypothetical protein
MLTGSKLKELTGGSSTEIISYKDSLSHIMYNPSLPECRLEYCEYCPGEQNLKEMPTDFSELQATDEMTYKQWLTKDRSTLETITHSTEEFLDIFFEKLQVLLCHSNAIVNFPKINSS